MARYTGPKTKIARKFGEAIFGDDKSFERKNYPPGQHGLARRRAKRSEYATQLQEKQNILMESLKNNSITYMKKLKEVNTSPVRCFFNFANLA